MPLLHLTALLQTALPDLSKAGRAIVSTLACFNGRLTNATKCAALAGLRDRHQLHRQLRRDGLPPFEQLAGWTRVLYWVSEAEKTGASLLELARREHTHAPAAYRLVRRVTGARWTQLRRGGLEVALLRLGEARKGHHPGISPILSRSHAQSFNPQASVTGATVRAGPRGVIGHPAGVLGDRVVVGASPFDVAVASTGIALVTCSHTAALDVVGLYPFERLGSIPTGAGPTRVQITRDGDLAYVTSQFAEEVAIIDIRAARQVASIPLGGHPLGEALAPDGRTLYVTSNTDRLYAVNTRQRRVAATACIPMGIPQISLHPAGHRVYVAGWKAGTITECDASTLRTVRTFAVGGIVQDIVVTTSGMLYAANESGWLDVIALGSGRRIARLETAGAAFGLALSPDESMLLVSLVFSGTVCVLDAHSLHVRATLAVAGKPRLMAFDRSGRSALVANEAGWVDQVV